MAYNWDEIYKQAIELSQEKGYHFIEDVISSLPCSRPIFYEHYPVESDELTNIKENLHINKIATKRKLRKSWEDSDNPTLQLADYKLLGTNEERRKLSQSFQDHTSGGDKITGFIYADPDDKTDKEAT